MQAASRTGRSKPLPHLSASLAMAILCLSWSAIAQSQNPTAPGAASESAANGQPEDLAAKEPSTTKELLSRFLAANPAARSHVLNMDMNAYAEGSAAAGLRLSRMWVGTTGVLVELQGLAVAGRANSAVIRRETFVLQDHTGAKSLTEFEGVTQLTDRRGGSALIVKPGETLLAQFQPADDSKPMRLQHSGPDGRTFVYFEDIDPRFRERYDATFALANASTSSPEQMKDFLVEFARKDPDGRGQSIFLKLIQAMRAKNTFEGYYNAYLLIQQPDDARKAWQLARTDEHRVLMEHMAVATLADKNRLFDFDLRLQESSTSDREGGCWMFCRYNFTASRSLRGEMQVKVKPTAPFRLRLGQYKVVLNAVINLPRRKLRESSWLGNYDGPDDIRYERDITLTVGPPDYAASTSANLGDLSVAFFQRGSAGGYEGAWATGDARIQLRIKSVDLVQ